MAQVAPANCSVKLKQACTGGDGATRSRHRHYAPTVAALPHEEPVKMDELATEAGPDRTTDDSASAEGTLGATRHLRGEQHPPHATA